MKLTDPIREEIAELREQVENLRRAGGNTTEWALRNTLAETQREVAALHAEVKALRQGLADISECSDDPGAVECANEAMKKLRAEWRKPGGLMDGPFI